MKTYLRLIKHTAPIYSFAISFFVLTALATFFGILNFTLLIPILDLLFGNSTDAVVETVKPTFEYSSDYIVKYFNYKIGALIQEYDKMTALKVIVATIVGSVLISNVFRYISSRILVRFKLNTVVKLRSLLYNKVVNLDIPYFTSTRRGDVITRVLSDTHEIENTLTNSIAVFFREPLKIIGLLFVLFNMSVELTLATLTIIPVSATLISIISKKLRRDANLAQQSIDSMINILDETINGIRIILGFNAKKYMNQKFVDENITYKKRVDSLAKRTELASPMSEFMGSLLTGVILLYGGSLVLDDSSNLSAGQFITFIIITSQLISPIKSMFTSFVGFQKGLVSGERILEILDEPIVMKDKENAIVLNEFEKNLVFNDVRFKYEKDEVIKGLNFELQKGETLALVGSSGGGKSTIADLICRFYDPSNGNVEIDGYDLKSVSIESLRAQMGIVSQESILFNDTVFNNIAFGAPETSVEKVKEAARIANAHEFIENLENGYTTLIGEKGLKLSGGQRQRLSIARAVLKNPPLLILDEATSALDTASEHLVQDAIYNLMKDRTSVVIAHRLSTIKHADKILVIDKGAIIEQGTHEELVNLNGVYKKLCDSQFA